MKSLITSNNFCNILILIHIKTILSWLFTSFYFHKSMKKSLNIFLSFFTAPLCVYIIRSTLTTPR